MRRARKFLTIVIFAILTTVHLQAKEAGVTPKAILETLQTFYTKFKGGDELIKKSEGYLVFPQIIKAGLIVGGEYGEGALVIKGSIKNYYRIYSTSIGIQAGAQKRSLLVLFFTKEALNKFINREEWKVGVDGGIAVMNWSQGTDLSSVDIRKDTIAIPFSNVGVMANISLEGTVFQKIK